MQKNIKVSYKLILSLFMGMIKHSQSTQMNKFVISLQYPKKEVWDGVHFLEAGINLMEVARHVQSFQKYEYGNIFAISEKKSVATAFLFCCDVKSSDILWGSSHAHCYLF